MTQSTSARKRFWESYVVKAAPGLSRLLRYQKRDLPHDLLAGLSVAAVALAIGWQNEPVLWTCKL